MGFLPVNMKKAIIILLFITLLCNVYAIQVTRTISSTTNNINTEIQIVLDIDVDGTDIVYSLKEIIPDNLTITDNGGGTQINNTLRWINFNGLVDTSYTYKVTGNSPGNYIFVGDYGTNNAGQASVSGSTSVIYSETSSTTSSSSGGGGGGGGGSSTTTTNIEEESDTQKTTIQENSKDILPSDEDAILNNSEDTELFSKPIIIILTILLIIMGIIFYIETKKA
jgi:hypothetical protein